MSSPLNNTRSPSMTKEQLKTALVQNRIPLPPSSARKEEYQKLYDEMIPQMKSDFSSDDDEPTDPIETTKSKVIKSSPTAVINGDFNGSSNGRETFTTAASIMAISNENLYTICVDIFGRDAVGPVMGSTRNLYLNKVAAHYGIILPNANGSNTGGDGIEKTNGESNSNGFSDSDDEKEVETASTTSRTSSKRSSSRGSASPRKAPRYATGVFVDEEEGGLRARARPSEITPSRDAGKKAQTQSSLEGGFNFRGYNDPSITLQSRLHPENDDTSGISYFKDRAGFTSATTSKTLPIKSSAFKIQEAKKKLEEEDALEELKENDGGQRYQGFGVILLLIILCIVLYMMRDTIFIVLGLSESGGDEQTGDELDTYLESLKD